MPSQQHLLEVINIQSEIVKLGLDLGQVMELVVERVVALVNADGAVIELAEGEDMVYRAASGAVKKNLGLRIKRDGSLAGLCVDIGKTLRCDDVEDDSRVDIAACRSAGIRSMIVMPLKYEDTAVGVLKAMSFQPYRFSEQDEAVLSLLSDVIAAAMYFATKLDLNDLYHKATRDSLTNLANRSLFMDSLRSAVAQSIREQSMVGVLMIDMDGLKYLNDTFGHRVGDQAIKELAVRIELSSRKSDTVARLGGDEFAVIVKPVEETNEVDVTIERIESGIVSPFNFENSNYRLSASIGAACFPKDSDNIDGLLELADQRMYTVKKNRPGRIRR